MLRISPALFSLLAVAYFLRVGASSIYIFDAAFLILIVGFLASARSIPARLGPVVFLFLLFLTANAVALSYGAVLGYHHGELKDFAAPIYRYSQIILCLIVYSTVATPLENADKLIRRLTYIATIPLAYNALGFVIRPDAVLVFGRASSYLDNPNTFGAYICAVSPFFGACFADPKASILSRREKLAVGGLLIMSLITAGSNSYWILSITGFLAGALAMFRHNNAGFSFRRLTTIFGSTLLVAGVAAVAFMQIDLDNTEIRGLVRTAELFQSVFFGESLTRLGSGELRDELQQLALQHLSENPLAAVLGIGIGQSPFVLERIVGDFVTVHNAYIVLPMEIGLLGTMSFFLALLVCWGRSGYGIHSGCAIIGYLLAMMATPHVYLPFLWYLIPASLGLGMRPQSQNMLSNQIA